MDEDIGKALVTWDDRETLAAVSPMIRSSGKNFAARRNSL